MSHLAADINTKLGVGRARGALVEHKVVPILDPRLNNEALRSKVPECDVFLHEPFVVCLEKLDACHGRGTAAFLGEFGIGIGLIIFEALRRWQEIASIEAD